MSLRVGIDIDGVLADFRSAFRQTAEGLGSVRQTAEGLGSVRQTAEGLGSVRQTAEGLGSVRQTAEGLGSVRQTAEGLGSVRQTAEGLGSVRQTAEGLGSVRQAAEGLGSVRQTAEGLGSVRQAAEGLGSVRRTAEGLGSTSRPPGDVDEPDGALSESAIKRAWKEVSAAHNWWTTLWPYEPAQIARLYALSREHGWEVFFLTKRPPTRGDTVQVQTQSWLEKYGFYLPAVVTVPGSRGELANALRLDFVLDDQELNCVEVISASSAKAVLMLRDASLIKQRDQAMSRGIGVVASVEEALTIFEGLQEVLAHRRGRLLRLADWFPTGRRTESPLPLNPRETRPLPE
jgi:hypothetical protein